MSDINESRRTAVDILFGGANITDDIRDYLLSVTYTDNEEDETDDLQIKLQDRDDVWLASWLKPALDAAAPAGPSDIIVKPPEVTYTVVKGDSLWKIAQKFYGKGSKFPDIYAANKGIIGNNPNRIYPGQIFVIPDVDPPEDTPPPPPAEKKTGFTIQAVFLRKNWDSDGDGNDKLLDCGRFELDAIDANGPPSTITVKGTSLPYGSCVRDTAKTRVWEACSMSVIAKQIASEGGMSCMFESANDPPYARVEQITVSDISFLQRLCHDAGISLKVTNGQIVLFDQAAYEAKPHVLTISRSDTNYMKWNLRTGETATKYASCRVRYTDPATGNKIEGTATSKDYSNTEGKQLEIKAKVSSIAEANALAEKRLRLANKHGLTAQFTYPGNPDLVAGLTVTLTGWGPWDGKYIIKRSQHKVDRGGYTTQIELRHALEG